MTDYKQIADAYFQNFCEMIDFSKETDEETKKAWLDLRKSGIGGSDTSCILGHNRFRNRKEIYKSKKEDVDQTSNFAIEFGNDFEPIIRNAFEKKYKETYAVIDYKTILFRNHFVPFFQASLDAGLVEKETNKVGILEIKTMQGKQSKWYYEDGTRGIPQDYIDQAIHYFNVTNAQFVIFYVLINNLNEDADLDMKFLRPRRINREDVLEYMNEVSKEEINFWVNYVEKGIEPKDRFTF